MNPEDTSHPPAAARDVFATTRWSLVVAAGRTSSVQSEQALNELCQTYWYPLYAYVRRQGLSHEDAEDRVQSFFARFLERNDFEGLSAERGRFRAFLLASMKHFLANEWDRSRRLKRGGGVLHLSFEGRHAGERFGPEPTDPVSPEAAYDREWALALLARVITRLREEMGAAGKQDLFEKAQGFLMLGTSDIPYSATAHALGMTEGALRVSVHRLRQRYRQLLRDEIRQTLTDPDQVSEELRSLQAALQS